MNKKEFVVIVTTNSFWTIHKIQIRLSDKRTGLLKFGVPSLLVQKDVHQKTN